MLRKLGVTVSRRPYLFIISWVILLGVISSAAIGGVFGDSLFDRMKSDVPTVSSQSKTADDLIKNNSTDSNLKTETVFVTFEGISPYKTDATMAKYLSRVEKDMKEYSDSYASPYGMPKEVFNTNANLSKLVTDKGFVIVVNVKGDNEEQLQKNVNYVYEYFENFSKAVEEQFDGVKISYGGKTAVVEQAVGQAERDLSKGEMIALPLTLLVMIIIFGGFLAAGMPLIAAIASIITAMGTLYGLSFFMNIDTTVLNVLTVIGLGLSIDYGLLMVSRFRNDLRHKLDNYSDIEYIHESVVDTVSTAGRTVLFSGLTVAAATATLLLFDSSLMKSIGIAASSVVIFAIITALTLLPAMFTVLGYKLIKPSPLQKIPHVGNFLKTFGDVAPTRGVFSKLASVVQKRPLTYAISSTLILLLMGSSVAMMNVTSNGVDKIGIQTEQGKMFQLLETQYPKLSEPDIKIVIDSKDNSLAGTYQGYADYRDIDNSFKTETLKDITIVSFNIGNTEREVQELKQFVETNGHSGQVYITGETARDLDYVGSLKATAPYVALIIIFITALLLFLMTGSLAIPIKAVILSILSLGASIGVLVWGFQEGHLAGILNFDASAITGIDPLILVMTLVFGFGLAMDYEMFLISAIKEKHAHGASTNLSVRTGLQTSGRIISSAALMIIIVFSGFAFGEMLMVKMMGVALATAVFIDATIVRMILLPAVVTILGDKIWWAPKWMKKIHDKYGINH